MENEKVSERRQLNKEEQALVDKLNAITEQVRAKRMSEIKRRFPTLPQAWSHIGHIHEEFAIRNSELQCRVDELEEKLNAL